MFTYDDPHERIHPAWYSVVLIAVIAGLVALCAGLFSGTFRTFVPVTLTADRSGIVMEPGAKVKMRGVQVGRVAAVHGGVTPVSLTLDLYPDQVEYIPSNVDAQIRATTAFGAKYVDLVYPESPSPEPISAGAVLKSRNVSTEVNTVFQNLVLLLKQIDPAKLNATLTAFADAVRGRGETIGQAITDANDVLLAVNPRMGTVQQDFRSFIAFSDAYADAAPQLLEFFNAASTTSTTITRQAADLDALLLGTIGFADSGVALLAPNRDNFVRGINGLQPTTGLLMKYNPEYTCLILGAKWFLDNGGYDMAGGNGKSAILDAGLLWGDDPYRYPDNLPIVAAKGGPGGTPGCGSLPDPSARYPVRQLITNTGFGTGLDHRPNPGIGHPWWVNYFPVTRAVPEPPSIRGEGPPAIGPVPYPGAPAYGAPGSPAPLPPPPPPPPPG
jgi:phospholipid/cholesterol/gamma-HCH transport system substrate-binding protein